MARVRPAPSVIKRNRWFAKKRFSFANAFTSKKEADFDAKDWKSMGHPARVVHLKKLGLYCVYVRNLT